MPQNREMSLRNAWTVPGASRITGPMAALGAFARGVLEAVVALVPQRQDPGPTASRARKELEIRQLEEHFAHAADHQDLEQMEREWGRRDGGGMRNW